MFQAEICGLSPEGLVKRQSSRGRSTWCSGLHGSEGPSAHKTMEGRGGLGLVQQQVPPRTTLPLTCLDPSPDLPDTTPTRDGLYAG